MPVKLWQQDKSGNFFSRIVTQWDNSLGGEEYREQAEELDQRLDEVLDDALKLVADLKKQHFDVSPKFLRTWSVGRVVRDSGILQLPALETERRQLLWRAMSWKCWLGIKHDYPESELCQEWQSLRSNLEPEVRNQQSDIKYLFGMGYWLQQQELEEAISIFGQSTSNANALAQRASIRVLPVRAALQNILGQFSEADRSTIHKSENFKSLIKALRKRWPDKGPGSADRPEHYPPELLEEEIRLILESVLADIKSPKAS